MAQKQAGARATEAADPSAAAAVSAKTTFIAFSLTTNPWATGWQPYDRRNAPFASSRPTSRSCKSLMTLCERCQRQSVAVQSVDRSALPLPAQPASRPPDTHEITVRCTTERRHSTATSLRFPSAVQSFALSVTGTCVNSSQDGSYGGAL